jgi:hypothetical protein
VQDPSWQTLIDRDDDMERLMDSEKEGDAVGRKVVQQLQHDGAEALKAKVCVNNWAGRRELDCEVVKETKTRYVCRLLSDGLLPRVRRLRSLISANTNRQAADQYHALLHNPHVSCYPKLEAPAMT